MAVLLPLLRSNGKESGSLTLIFYLTLSPPSHKFLKLITLPDIHLGEEFRVLENYDGDLLIADQHSIFIYGKDVVYSLTGKEETRKIIDLLPLPDGGYLILTSRSLMAGEKTWWHQRRIIVLRLNEDWEIIRKWDTDFVEDVEFSLGPEGTVIVCGKGVAALGRPSIIIYSLEGEPLHYAFGDLLSCRMNSTYLGSGKLVVRTTKHTLRVVDLFDHSTRDKSPLFHRF